MVTVVLKEVLDEKSINQQQRGCSYRVRDKAIACDFNTKDGDGLQCNLVIEHNMWKSWQTLIVTMKVSEGV